MRDKQVDTSAGCANIGEVQSSGAAKTRNGSLQYNIQASHVDEQ